MTDNTVPLPTSLTEIYHNPDIPHQTQRWQALTTRFASIYGHAPLAVARSPGRVNLIGEHIDYSLYGVLPTAITEDAIIALSWNEPSEDGDAKFEIANMNDGKFPLRTFTVSAPRAGDSLDADSDEGVPIDATLHEWTNYFRSGLRGALRLLRSRRGAPFRPVSTRVLVDGSVPVGGGLSSSAALVTASALAVLIAHGERAVSKVELTELAVVSERAVGVNSGGMDQSASVFSRRNAALYVSFYPTLTARPVTIPTANPPFVFLIAQSFVAADKHVGAPIHYNLRVVECSLAAAYLHAKHVLPVAPAGATLERDSSPLGVSLRSFQESYFRDGPGKDLGDKTEMERLEIMLRLAEESLAQEEGYTREEMAKVLNTTPEALNERFTSRFPVRADRFLLRQRAIHVFAEALRVQSFLSLLGPESSSDSISLGPALGRLMNETQRSCNELYDCSCPEIEDLCRIARDSGTYGSRLTGAGWGGCTVHLVPEDRVADVRRALEEKYYAGRALSPEQMAQAVVVSRPGNGSAVVLMGEAVI